MSNDLIGKLREAVRVTGSQKIPSNGWHNVSVEFEEDAISLGPHGSGGTFVESVLEVRVARRVVRETGVLGDDGVRAEKEKLAQDVHHYLYGDVQQAAYGVLHAIKMGTKEDAERMAIALVEILSTENHKGEQG